jgi:cobalt-precorrin-5B (C1)-methyltransferase
MSPLRSGLTTGTCAAAAAKAATLVLLGRENLGEVDIALPDGTRVAMLLIYAQKIGTAAEAAVCKDAGDDPDITHGTTILARVSWLDTPEIRLIAGNGVGTVTKPGLSVPPGQPAINPVPQRMIREGIREITEKGVEVVISIPGGKELAEKTFNPRLGIVGGLSILGTTGRVRPFSSPALRSSLKCSLDVAAACGVEAPVLVPGHIGERAARRHFHLLDEQLIEVSNEWGYMLDCAGRSRFRGVMVLGHPGKMGKLAMGEWDTHSSRSKSAVPWISDLAGALGCSTFGQQTVEGIFSALSAAERKKLGAALASEVLKAVRQRLQGSLPVAAVLVNMQGDWLGCAGEMGLWKRKNPSELWGAGQGHPIT